MSHKEEQDQEVEALASIFPNEIEFLEKEPFHSILFNLKTDKYDTDPKNEARISVIFSFNENYPDEIPYIKINDSENIRNEDQIIEFLKNCADENRGMPMIYTIVCCLIEKLNKDNDERKIFEANEKDRIEKEREEEELKRFEGTKVTVESFLKWKAVFDKEMQELKKHNIDQNRKQTGKSLFEKDDSLFNSDLKFINNDEPVEVDESLFQNLDDLDFDDDDEDYIPESDEEE